MDAACYLGVDLGGTQLRIGAVGPDGRLLTEILSVPTGRGFGPGDLVSQLDASRSGSPRCSRDAKWRRSGSAPSA